MAATVTPLLTKFSGADGTTSDCESVGTSWSGSPVLDTINNLENLGCLSKKVSNTALTFMYTLVSGLNLTNEHIFVWMMVTTVGKLDTKANGGMRIRIEDASANWREWNVGGGDTYKGGWKNFAVEANGGWTTQSATPPNITAITKVGVVFKMAVSVTGNVTNCFWDVLRYGSGLKITGGTSGTPGKFQDIINAENVSTNFYGILRNEGGVLFCSGELIFGDTSSGDTYFTDTGQVLVFEDKPVNSGLYKIKLQGNASGAIEIKFGTKIGSGETAVGTSGCIFRSASKANTPFKIDALGSNIDVYGFYGCTFQDGGVTQFDKISTNTAETITSSWNNMARAEIGATFVRSCTFSGYTPDTLGALLWNANIDIKNSQFLANTDSTNNPAAIEHPAQGSFTYYDLTFSGNDYDINYTALASSGVLTILKSGTSNPSTSKILNATGNSVSIEASTTLNIYIVDSEGATITANCEVTIVRNSDEVILFEEDGILDGSTAYNFTTGGGIVVYINVHNVAGYLNRTINNYTLPSSGTVDLTIQLDVDRFYST